MTPHISVCSGHWEICYIGAPGLVVFIKALIICIPIESKGEYTLIANFSDVTDARPI